MLRRILAPLLTAALLLPSFAYATADYIGSASTAAFTANDNQLPEDNINTVIGTIIMALFGFLGVVFLVLVIYAGLLWMTAGGNADSVKKAKSILINSVIGLIILLSSYAIATTVLQYLSSSAY